jgi:hypothetical protein
MLSLSLISPEPGAPAGFRQFVQQRIRHVYLPQQTTALTGWSMSGMSDGLNASWNGMTRSTPTT